MDEDSRPQTESDSPLDMDLQGSTDEDIEYYDNDTKLPVFARPQKGMSTTEAMHALITVDKSKIATTVPVGISSNVVFIIKESAIGNYQNALSDSMGAWQNNGTHEQRIREKRSMKKYTIARTNYVNKSSNDLRRILIQLKDGPNTKSNGLIFLQYYFTGEPHVVNILPHGNSKTKRPYQRTMKSTKDKIYDLCKENIKPKSIEHQIMEENGGLLSVRTGSQICRDRHQINNIKAKIRTEDPVLACADMAKMQETMPERFVRDVGCGPEFNVFMASDTQLHDVQKFCTNAANFSILGVDTTFNIGQYYLTLTTYRHLMLLTRKGEEPVMIGPALLHQRKMYKSYFKLPAYMIQVRKITMYLFFIFFLAVFNKIILIC
jgi:hypothetical protein